MQPQIFQQSVGPLLKDVSPASLFWGILAPLFKAFGIFCLTLKVTLCWKLPDKSLFAPWLPGDLQRKVVS